MQPEVGGVGGRGLQVTQYVWHLDQKFLSTDGRVFVSIIGVAHELPPNHHVCCVPYEAITDLF